MQNDTTINTRSGDNEEFIWASPWFLGDRRRSHGNDPCTLQHWYHYEYSSRETQESIEDGSSDSCRKILLEMYDRRTHPGQPKWSIKFSADHKQLTQQLQQSIIQNCTCKLPGQKNIHEAEECWKLLATRRTTSENSEQYAKVSIQRTFPLNLITTTIDM